ncbi:MAG TPA: FAD-binding oxidoreductase [Candidatus Limnocylindrales bacterium]|nr:FAD-binding oxidoreductase [Candidatus Limnocylindrales bacterium]
MTETADAIIVGAGIHGASLAFHLAESGLKPIILERSTAAVGATGRSSGLVRMHYDVEADARLAWVSHGYFANWSDRVGGDAGFVRTGFVQLVPPNEVEALRQNVAMQQRLGIDTRLIGPEEVKARVPGAMVDDVQVAAWEEQSGYADPTMTTTSLIAAAVDRGARLVTRCTVSEVLLDGDRVIGVETSRGRFEAPVVVDAAGAWAGPLAASAGVEVPLQVWRHDVAYVRRPEGMARHPVIIDFANSMYARPEGDNLTLVALEDGNPLGGSPDAPVDAAAPGFLERAAERLSKRLPAMEDAGLHSAHSGQDGITPDQHPIIGPAGPDGFYLDCGFSGTGFKIAPAVGVALAELIRDGEARVADLRPYRFERFAENDPIVGEHPYAPIWR